MRYVNDVPTNTYGVIMTRVGLSIYAIGCVMVLLFFESMPWSKRWALVGAFSIWGVIFIVAHEFYRRRLRGLQQTMTARGQTG